MTEEHGLTLVKGGGTFPKVTLVSPHEYGYVLAGARVDSRPPFAFFIESGKKKRLLKKLKTKAETLRAQPGVRDVTLLKTVIMPPGRGEFLKKRPDVHIARYDVALWVEADDPAAANALRLKPLWGEIEGLLRAASKDVMVVTGRNARRMGDVDHGRDGVFLLNYFYADKTEQNLAVWEYTAGWFEDQTDLHNSILLLPEDQSATDYKVINHCRWDRLGQILPHILFNRSFRKYVLAHFAANNTAPIPILYRLA